MTDHRQELFDKVSKHLITQGKPAKLEDGRCRYRTPDGLSCAVGCLIKDGLYRSVFEGVGFPNSADGYGDDERQLMLFNAVCDSLGYKLNYNETTLLQELQNLHDNLDSWDDISGELQGVALEHGLTFNG